MELNEDYWENRYQEKTARWDLGRISTPIKEYIDQLENKELKIALILILKLWNLLQILLLVEQKESYL